MAQITLNTSEIDSTLDLMESIFPGLNLTPIKTVFANTTITGEVMLSKKMKDETLNLLVKISK